MAVSGKTSASTSGGFTGGSGEGQPVPDKYIVVLNPGSSPSDVEGDHNSSADHDFTAVLNGFSAKLTATQRDELLRDPRVNNVVQDRVVKAIGYEHVGEQAVKSGVVALAETIPTGIDRIDAEGAAASTAHIAIIDTGIDLTHPDLNVAPAAQRFSVYGTDCNDGNGHGTHVSGTAAAIGNAIGVRGVAPGAIVHCVQVLNSSGSGTFDGLIAGINWVTANAAAYGILDANMSLSGCYTSGGVCVPPPGNATCGMSGAIVVDPVHKAICDSVNAGVVHVVAAGNSTADASTQVPAAYPEVITVSAIADYNGKGPAAGAASSTCYNWGPDDGFASFTNYGTTVDIAAPGVCILSTWMGGVYNTISGTSMAAPHVTGAVAAYLSTHPMSITLATWPSVEATLIAALSRPRTDPACGTVSSNHSVSNEPVLYVGQPLANCNGVATTPTPTAAPATSTSVPSTATRTSTPTGTPVPATATRTSTPTGTPVPATATRTSTATRTPVPATATPTALTCAAPTITSASDTNPSGGGTISFTWNSVTGATQYKVQRQRSDGTWSTRQTSSATSYTGSDPSSDPSWRVFVSAGSCAPLPGPAKVFDPPTLPP